MENHQFMTASWGKDSEGRFLVIQQEFTDTQSLQSNSCGVMRRMSTSLILQIASKIWTPVRASVKEIKYSHERKISALKAWPRGHAATEDGRLWKEVTLAKNQLTPFHQRSIFRSSNLCPSTCGSEPFAVRRRLIEIKPLYLVSRDRWMEVCGTFLKLNGTFLFFCCFFFVLSLKTPPRSSNITLWLCASTQA